MTEPNGAAWVQTIYYPFLYASRFGRGSSLRISVDSPTYACAVGDAIPVIDCAATLAKDGGEIVLFLINRSLDRELECTISLADIGAISISDYVSVYGFMPGDGNTADVSSVFPRKNSCCSCGKGQVTATLPRFSWNMIRVKIV